MCVEGGGNNQWYLSVAKPGMELEQNGKCLDFLMS